MSGGFDNSSVFQLIRLSFCVVIFFGPHTNGDDTVYNNRSLAYLLKTGSFFQRQ
jgi:hypothetical protein